MEERRPPQFRLRAIAILLGGICCDSGDGPAGCTADNNAIDPVAQTPSDRVEVGGTQIWRVRWDNPVVGAQYELPSIGYAIRQGYAWHYNKFDLELDVDDADPAHRLYTWPSFAGTYGDDEDMFQFESHGMKLEPMVDGEALSSIATASGIHDAWNGPELLLEDPLGNTEGRFQLDPAVGLVPLRVVVLHGGPLTAPGFFGPALSAGWLSHNSAELLIDDRWEGTKLTNTMAPYFPDFVETEWTHRPGTGQVASAPIAGGGRHMQPDRVFDQCDVQFRMLSYHTCQVPPDILYDSQCLGSLGQTGHANTVRNYVAENCDVPSDVAKVIFVGSLAGSNCFDGTLNGAQVRNDVLITNMFAGKTTLAHELGHLVGLNHTKTSGNLMAPGSGIVLDEEECSTANAVAHTMQAAYWD